MFTETLEVADSQDPSWNEGSPGALAYHEFRDRNPVEICDGVAYALKKAGWTPDGGTAAAFSLVLPYGLPWTTIPDPPPPNKPVRSWGPSVITIDGRYLMFYDPYRDTPDYGRTDIRWVPMGTSLAESMSNLAAAIESYGWIYRGSWQQTDPPLFNGWWHMDFEAPETGTAWNHSALGGQRAVNGASATVWYAGHIWRYGATGPGGRYPADGGIFWKSKQHRGGWLRCWIGVPGTEFATFRFTTSYGNDEREYKLNTYRQAYSSSSEIGYRVIANQFQFVVIPKTVNDPASILYIRRNLLASVPWLKPNHGVTFSAVVAGGGTYSFLASMDWMNAGAYTALNGPFSSLYTSSSTGRGVNPGIYPIRSKHALTNELGETIVANALLAIPPEGPSKDLSKQARVVGRLWDALVLQRNNINVGSTMRFGKWNWICVGKELQESATSDNTKASLWVAYEKVQ